MKAHVNAVKNTIFVNLGVADMKKAVAAAEAAGDNEIAVSLFIRSGAGPDNLHSLASLAEKAGAERLFLVSGDIATRTYTPRQRKVVE